MPSLFKQLSSLKVESFFFPDVSDLEDDLPEEGPAEEKAEPPQEPIKEAEPPDRSSPIEYARYQADMIEKDARRQAEEILQNARREAERILEQARQNAGQAAEEVQAEARNVGLQEGYAQGIARAMEESRQKLVEQTAEQELAVQQFLEKAADTLDRQLDDNVADLRDLALAVAEKVVCVSLKSSSEVIGRMIQRAVDKRKHREWVHIYIAECDARRMAAVPPALAASLATLSERVRIIPIADDESGTCIIEMPNEIIDASATTQMNNIRSLLSDAPSGRFGGDLF